MKLNASVLGRSAKNERKWPIRPFWIASRPLNSCDHEYCPVTTQLASSARLSAKVVPLRAAESAKICCTSFLLSAALIGGFSLDWLIADHCLPARHSSNQ